jgi:nicotinate-nucleotide adenylyltransferase
MRIALFGTSADPPTVGHREILIGLAAQFDQVWVWASDNPFKQHGASLTARSEMLGLIVTEANQHLRDRFSGDDCPRDHFPKIYHYPHLSHRYTIVSLERAQTQVKTQGQGSHPNATFNPTFTLVIGSDLIAQLPHWYRSQELLQQVELLIIPRPNFPLEGAALQQLQELQQLGTTVHIAHWQGLPVSSTAFRETGDREPLTDLVYQFIRQHQLYPARFVSTLPS